MEPANSNGNLYQKDSEASSQNKLYLVLGVVTFCLALAAFIIAIASVAQQNGGQTTVNVSSAVAGQSDTSDDKVWLLHIGHTGTNIEYIDEESGQVKGFNPDIVNAVCRLANKNCRLVFDIYTNCWDSKSGETARGGFGLMAGWFDSCAAWRISKERQRTFAFTDPFSRSPFHAFVTLPGNPEGFNWKDLTGKKIAFIDGFSSSEHCLAQAEGITGNVLGAEQIFHYQSFEGCYDALVAKEVDAIFLSTVSTRGVTSVEVVSGEFAACELSGFGMMTRFDAKLIEWWNPAQARLLASPEYKQICQDVKEVHGHMPGLDPEDFCI